MTVPDPNYPAGVLYGLQGGFLQQNNGNVSGQVFYYIALDQLQNGAPVACDSGSAIVTGTISGQTVTLTAAAETQAFLLTGTIQTNGSISGTFTTGGGQITSGGQTQVCGAATAQGGNQAWTAISVPSITGAISGTFHSTGIGLNNQDFQVTGSLSQGQNMGASSATVTGQLSFANPTTLVSMYPCFPSGYVNVNGQISGNTVILQLIGTDGSNDGQVGIAASSVPNSQGLTQVTFDPAMPSGYFLHSTNNAYQVTTKSCGSSVAEIGAICLGVNNTTVCQQPITFSPPTLTFAPQLLMCTSQNCPPNGEGTATTQTITLTNNQSPGGAPLTGLTLSFNPEANQSDFTELPDFSESDNCSSFLSSSTPGQSCTITITFTPQESCTWQPDQPGLPTVAGCPVSLTASLTVSSPVTNDNDSTFAVPITGSGLSFVQPSVKELDFGAEAVGEASEPQLLSFTNQSAYPVQILGSRSSPCVFSAKPTALPSPLVNDGAVGGLQVIITNNQSYVAGPPPTFFYNCDVDQKSELPNFQISSDSCTGMNLQPQASCSIELSFIPQPTYTQFATGLDYFLQMNSLQCGPLGASSDCEIDSGRVVAEIKANGFSPLRMTPAAGLDFGVSSAGKTTAAQTVTLFNDPSDPNTATVNFSGKFIVTGNFTETDDCPISFAPGSTCTLTVTGKPSVGFNQGAIEIFYTLGSSTTTPSPQFVYLRGTGQ